MKRILAITLAAMMLVGALPLMAAAEEKITVVVNGTKVDFPDEQPYYTGERVMVPVRFVSEQLGGEVAWFEKTKTVTVMDKTNAVALTVDSPEVTANNTEITLDIAPTVRNDRTYVPLRLISEALGAQVDWEEDTKTVTITRAEQTVDEGNDKKVYALYHGFRRTREHDGDLGSWKQYYDSSSSATGLDHINYSADLMDENGIHQLASINGGPVVGMQSEIDPDYVEYKMLLAKIANIDGFMVDFGFPEYTNTVLMKAFMEQAQKYGLEIGADWCDSWLVANNWIQNYRSDIQTREDKLDYFKTSVQFLIDEVYNTPSGAMIDGHPVIFLFGGGPTSTELQDILQSEYQYPDGMEEPYYIRRATLGGTYSNGTVRFSDAISSTSEWINVGVDVHQWIVPRVRPMDENYPYYDNYATLEDVQNYAQAYKQLWDRGQKVNVNTAVVTPGFDNRGCAGWGSGKYLGLDRADGEVYRWQWDFYNQNKNQIDVVFIASWSDFTEGHEIEPTVKNGYRELETTLEYASAFRDKDVEENAKEALQIPQQIFESRKYAEKLEKTGFEVSDMIGLLDAAALGTSKGAYTFAQAMIGKAAELQKECEQELEIETITVSSTQGGLTITSYAETADPAQTDLAAATQPTVVKGRNIAKGKNVTTNDEDATGPVSNLVDGVIADASRWITSQNGTTYWAEIDFGAEYEIVAADLYAGKDDGSWALETVRLEYLKGGEWVTIPETETTGNSKTNTDLSWVFAPVTTSKVRLVSDDGTRGVRVRELMVYTQGDPSLVEDESFLALRGRELAQGKPVAANSELTNGTADKAVDGYLTDNSMWMTTTEEDSYILEIDLQESCRVMGADVYSGMSGGTWAVENVRVQYRNNGVWVDVPGGTIQNNPKTKTELRWNFAQTVETDKVRFCFDDGTRGVKIREIKLYDEPASVETSETEVYNMAGGIYLTIDENIAQKLRGNYFDAMLQMQYLGNTEESFTVKADCNRPLPEKIGVTQGDFSVVADVRQEITYTWEQCRIEMYKDNLALEHKLEQNADFVINGTGNIRNIEMTFQVWNKK